MPYYRKYGKIQTPLTDKEFLEGMKQGHFVERKHRGFVALLYYFAIRKSEGLKAKKEQFRISGGDLYFDVGKRLKHSKTTPPLNVPLDAPYVDEILWSIQNTGKGKRVWSYSEKTGYNIVDRVFKYPHYFRLSRITNFFLEGWTIAQVRSWTGLTLTALEYYVGLVDISRMGRSLGQNHERMQPINAT